MLLLLLQKHDNAILIPSNVIRCFDRARVPFHRYVARKRETEKKKRELESFPHGRNAFVNIPTSGKKSVLVVLSFRII